MINWSIAAKNRTEPGVIINKCKSAVIVLHSNHMPPITRYSHGLSLWPLPWGDDRFPMSRFLILSTSFLLLSPEGSSPICWTCPSCTFCIISVHNESADRTLTRHQWNKFRELVEIQANPPQKLASIFQAAGSLILLRPTVHLIARKSPSSTHKSNPPSIRCRANKLSIGYGLSSGLATTVMVSANKTIR